MKEMSKYGLPYLGSKNKIAEDIIILFPPADNFYDLFAGGCAITHALLINNDLLVSKYKKYFINDIQDTPKLFLDAVAGKYKDEKRWISREDFNKNKELEQLERLEQSYDTVPILPNSVIYCDPPYNVPSKDYIKDRFNHKKFWVWAEKQTCPIFVSEYNYTGENPDKWKIVYEKEKINLRAKKSGGTRIRNIERVFWNQI